MAHFKKNKMARLALMVAPVLALALTACETPERSVDYRQNYPIKVASERVAITILVPDAGKAMEPMDETRFNRFLRDYVGRGRGRVEVSAPLGEGEVAAMRVRKIQSFLNRQGLSGHQVLFNSSGVKESRRITLTFAANKVIVPTCRDWQKGPGFNLKNLPDHGFGCSYQRNLGLMVADPGDLVQARPMTGRDMGADHGEVESIPVTVGSSSGTGQ